MSEKTYTKDPNAVLDWKFDWSDWLADGETISTSTVTVGAGLTKDSDVNDGSTVTVWLSGGTANQEYDVASKIATSASRTDERTITIQVRDR